MVMIPESNFKEIFSFKNITLLVYVALDNDLNFFANVSSEEIIKSIASNEAEELTDSDEMTLGQMIRLLMSGRP